MIDTKKIKVEELNEDDRVQLDGKWRTFMLATPSEAEPGHVNILVKDTSKRFFRVKAGEKIVRQEVTA